MRNKIILSIVLIITLCSCSNKSSNFLSYIEGQLMDCTSFIENYKYIVLIPRSGCHACIEQADSFFKRNKDDKEYLFIFTKLISEKRLRIELGSTDLSLPNVVVDKTNKYYSSEYPELNYPLIIESNIDRKLSYSYLGEMMKQ